MRSLGLAGVVRGKRPRTTVPNPADSRAADLLNRDFTAPAPDEKWITDFTYVRTYQSSTYVAFIVDCFSQKIVGWPASVKRDVELVDVPLRMALWRRGHEGTPVGRDQLICHSDEGSQYASVRFTEHLRLEGISPFDRKRRRRLRQRPDGDHQRPLQARMHPHQRLSRRPRKTIVEVEYATASWVEWYNNRRLHSSLGMISPIENEAAHYAETEPRAD